MKRKTTNTKQSLNKAKQLKQNFLISNLVDNYSKSITLQELRNLANVIKGKRREPHIGFWMLEELTNNYVVVIPKVLQITTKGNEPVLNRLFDEEDTSFTVPQFGFIMRKNSSTLKELREELEGFEVEYIVADWEWACLWEYECCFKIDKKTNPWQLAEKMHMGKKKTVAPVSVSLIGYDNMDQVMYLGHHAFKTEEASIAFLDDVYSNWDSRICDRAVFSKAVKFTKI